MGNKQTHSESDDPGGSRHKGNALPPSGASGAPNTGEDGEDPVVEVPPPMQPIASVPALEEGKKVSNHDIMFCSSLNGLALQEANGDNLAGAAAATNDPSTAGDAGQPSCDVQNPPALSADEISKTLQQRQYRLQELFESEKTYVQDLEQCVAYIKFMKESKEAEEPEIPMPDDLKEGKDRMIFGNIEAIYEWHRE